MELTKSVLNVRKEILTNQQFHVIGAVAIESRVHELLLESIETIIIKRHSLL